MPHLLCPGFYASLHAGAWSHRCWRHFDELAMTADGLPASCRVKLLPGCLMFLMSGLMVVWFWTRLQVSPLQVRGSLHGGGHVDYARPDGGEGLSCRGFCSVPGPLQTVQRAQLWEVILALQASEAVHFGVDNLNVVRHVGRLLDGVLPSRHLELEDDGDLLGLVQKMISNVELLVLCELCAGEHMFWTRQSLAISGLVAQFQCRLFLLVQALIFGVPAASLVV